MGSKSIDIPIVKSGKDICRLIFTQFDDGLFDIKIDSREKSFRVQTYSLFSARPREIYPYDLEDYKEHDISYHHGTENKPIVVHIKSKEKKENEMRYRSLPLCHLQAPNINNDFPLPIFKIEIPSDVVNSSKQYEKKNRHHPIDIFNSNVVEVYMTNDANDVSNNIKKYARISFIQLMMSMEYFCTNTIISGSQKMHTYIPHKPESRCTIIGGLKGLKIMVNYYPEVFLDKRRKSMYFTFIENEYAEDILMNTIIVYPEEKGDGSFDNIYVGGASTRDLSILAGKNEREQITDAFGQMKNNDGSLSGRRRYTAAQATLYMDRLTLEEKAAIIKKAIPSAERLYQLSVEKEKEKLQVKNMIYDRSKKFRRVVSNLQKENRQRLNENEGSFDRDPVLLWLVEGSGNKEEQSYLMLSKYLQMDDCRLGCCKINEKQHWWLLFDDYWDVDIYGDHLNQYLNPEDNYNYEEIIVTVGLDPTYTIPYIPTDTTHIKDNCIMVPQGYKLFSRIHRDQVFKQNNKLLEKVYCEIVREINA